MTAKERRPFEGFPRELPEFLWGLALHNEKPWFEAHREQYERCLHEPVQALARQVWEALEERCPGAAPALHVSRIHRDARRLYGRGPYNDHLWFSMGRSAAIYAPFPQFWFGIEARCYTYGVGLWNAGGETLERWRASIDADPARLTRIVKKLNRMEGFERYGQVYRRPKGDPGPLLFDWYNSRALGVERTVWFEPDPPGPELAQALAADYEKLMPLYNYLLEI